VSNKDKCIGFILGGAEKISMLGKISSKGRNDRKEGLAWQEKTPGNSVAG
jgi:hypothetical protein